MKNNFLILLLLFVSVCNNLFAVPADPTPAQVMQPDGSILTIRLHGDEFTSYTTTEDGYTVLINDQGYYVYAERDASGAIVAGTHVAKDPANRLSEENVYLSSLQKYLRRATPAQQKMRQQARSMYAPTVSDTKQRISSDNFKGLIILAQFTDRSFISESAKRDIEQRVNTKNYSEINSKATGSVRDYFFENSSGQFDPVFDVVGPVTLDYTQTYVNGNEKAAELAQNACEKADELVNFADYDLNQDGEVDMVYIIYAGHGSNVIGNNPQYVWPHAYKMWENQVILDGVRCFDYACSTEMQGSMRYNIQDGIGTICHEFSHVLGLPDFYDTNGEDENGREAPNPGEWSVMANGNYKNNGYTPVGYSAFERYAVGWLTPVLLQETGEYTLRSLAEGQNEAYRINSAVNKEYFILENRQKVNKWDRYLPGSGMLIHRIDSTNAQPWLDNRINASVDRVYYELLRADNTSATSSGNSFPGYYNKTVISDETQPGLKAWNGEKSNVSVMDIKEESGLIKFSFVKRLIGSFNENFENMTKPDWAAAEVEGVFMNWKLSNAIVTEAAPSTASNGKKAIWLKKGGYIEMMDNLPGKVKSLSIVIAKKAGIPSYQIEYSLDKGTTWVALNKSEVINSATKVSRKYSFESVESEKGCRVRISCLMSEVYLDDVNLEIYDAAPPTAIIEQNIDDVKVYAYQGQIRILMDRDDYVSIYDITGKLHQTVYLSQGWNTITMKGKHNFYIVKIGSESYKVGMY